MTKNLKNCSLGLFLVVAVAGQSLYGIQEASIISEEQQEPIVQVEKAQKEKQGIIGRWSSKAKKMVTKPVNYVFGEESSYAKTAFYTVVGAAILAVGTYGTYRYFYGNALGQAGSKDTHVTVEEMNRYETERKAYQKIVLNLLKVNFRIKAANYRKQQLLFDDSVRYSTEEMARVENESLSLKSIWFDLVQQRNNFIHDRSVYVPLKVFRESEEHARNFFVKYYEESGLLWSPQDFNS